MMDEGWMDLAGKEIDEYPNGDAMRKCILEGPYTPTTVIIPAVPATDNSPAVPERTTVETVLNMSPENKAHFESEKEAIHLILTGIGDEIYSTVDACKTAHEMWESYQKATTRFYKLMNEMIRNNLTVATMQVNVQFLQQLQPEWSSPNTVATAQPYQDPYYQTLKSHKSSTPTSKASLPTRSHTTTRHNGKETTKPITPPSELASEEDSNPEQAQKDTEMQKNLALIAKYKNDNQFGQFGNQRTMTIVGARETVGGQVVQQSGIQCFNYKEFGYFAKECRKPKRVKDSTHGIEEIDDKSLEAHYSYMAKIQEVLNADSGTDSEPLEHVQYILIIGFANEIQHSEQSESISNTCVVDTGDRNVILDSPDVCDNDI
ncbi:retrovirus-related pol polyprotein from transposon TNT 1-94 [Tanacetum coccineum]